LKWSELRNPVDASYSSEFFMTLIQKPIAAFMVLL
jgi:hypothetical protein